MKKIAIIVLSIGIAGLILSCDAILLLDNNRSSGDPLWVKSNNSSIKSSFYSIVEANGYYYTIGSIDAGTILFGNNIFTTGTKSSNNPILLRIDKNGIPQWATGNLTAVGVPSLNNVTVSNDAIYGVGSGNGSLLSKFTEQGTSLWSCTAVGPFPSLYDAAILDNSIYMIGEFGDRRDQDPMDFGNGILLNQTGLFGNPIFAKYDLGGTLCWAKTVLLGEVTKLSCFSIADAPNAIYLAGYIEGGGVAGTNTVDFGDSVVLSTPSDTVYPCLIKYNTNGVAQWVKTITSGDSGAKFYKIAIRNDSIYAVGTIGGNNGYYFDESTMTRGPDPNNNCVLVKYDLNGNAYWARTLLFGGSSAFTGVAVTDDAVYACGSLGGFALANFGYGVTLEAANYSNPVLVKYDLNGTPLWAKTITPQTSGIAAAQFKSIAVDNEGVYAVGSIGKGIYSLGTRGTIQGGADENYLIIKYKK